MQFKSFPRLNQQHFTSWLQQKWSHEFCLVDQRRYFYNVEYLCLRITEWKKNRKKKNRKKLCCFLLKIQNSFRSAHNCRCGLQGLQVCSLIVNLWAALEHSNCLKVQLLTVLKAGSTQSGPVMTTSTKHALKKAPWKSVSDCSCCPLMFGLVLCSLAVLELKIDTKSGLSPVL